MDERLKALAESVRGKNLVEPAFPPEYLAYAERETVQRETVDTCEGPVPVYIHRAVQHATPCRLFINIHGGGFVRPLIATNIHFCSRIAVCIEGIVVDIDYSLAPEHPFPTAFNQCYDVVRWVFENAEKLGSRPDLVCLGGHSAGANLTAAILLKAAQTKQFNPRLQIHDFGGYDMDTDPADKPGIEENLVPLDRCRAFNEMYVWNDPSVTKSPYVSPLFAPDEWLRDQPEALIITGGTDTFRFEGERYGLRLAAQGVRVTMQRFEGCPHGFTVNCVGKWKEAQDLIIRTIRSVTP